MKLIVLCMLMIASWGTYAKTTFPYDCNPIPVTSNTVMLPKGTPSLMMLHNTSDMDLWITHPISNPDANAGWSSRLQSQHWSALALGNKAFELSCIESKPGHEQQVPCSLVLTVCQWSPVTNSDQQTTPNWVGENMLLSELIGHLNQKGYKLPEPSQQ